MAPRARLAALAAALVVGVAGGGLALAHAVHRPRPAAFRNGNIAFVAQSEGHARIYIARADGNHPEALTPPVIDADHPAWSPDGERIAFDAGDIFVINADGWGGRQLTHGDQAYSDPAWSPDGRRIAFAGSFVPFPGASKIQSIGLFVSDIVGTRTTQLPTLGSGCAPQHPSWSPDGERIAFVQLCRDGTSSIYTVDAMGRRFVSVPGTVGAQSGPSWSPDGTSLLYTVTTGIELSSLDGRQQQVLTYALDSSPSYSPDGRKILFVRERAGVRHLYVMNANGSEQRSLTKGTNPEDSPAWQPVPAGGVPAPSPVPLTPTPGTFACQGGSVTGDFDGDGHPDIAGICRTESGAYQLLVTWEGIASGTVYISDCRNVCRTLGASDLNGDGSDELFLEVEERGSTRFVEVYELPASETFGRSAVRIAKPGAPGYPAGRAARFPVGTSEEHKDILTCPIKDDGQRFVLAHRIDRVRDNDRYPWKHHETDLIFSGNVFTIWSVSDEPLPSTYPMGPDAFQPACW